MQPSLDLLAASRINRAHMHAYQRPRPFAGPVACLGNTPRLHFVALPQTAHRLFSSGFPALKRTVCHTGPTRRRHVPSGQRCSVRSTAAQQLQTLGTGQRLRRETFFHLKLLINALSKPTTMSVFRSTLASKELCETWHLGEITFWCFLGDFCLLGIWPQQSNGGGVLLLRCWC